jgi:ribosomal protein S14
MLSLKFKDLKKRNSFFKTELKLKALKYFFINTLHSNKKLRKQIITFFLKETTCLSKTKLQRRCIVTNRSKVSNRKLGISRIKLREMLKFNIFPGYKKAIW